MSTHTPGPWRVSRDKLGPVVLGQIGGELVTVADQIDEGDARLIAAAPRMLELLRQIATMSYSVIDMANDAKAILRDVKVGSNG